MKGKGGFPFNGSDEDRRRWFENLIDQQYSTSGHKKFVRYLEAVLKTDEYKKLIKKWREKYSIPSNGYKPTLESAGNEGYVLPVKNWTGTYEQTRAIQKEIKKFCLNHHLHFMYTYPLIEIDLFYNEPFDPNDMVRELGAFNLCSIADLALERIDPYGKDFQQSDDMAYPVAIRISPYASLRDILDFIKKTYSSSIEPMQDRYRDTSIKLGHSRKRKEKIKERNNFIYEHKNLPRRKIMQLVNERFSEILDYGHIGKIISIEERKRKQV